MKDSCRPKSLDGDELQIRQIDHLFAGIVARPAAAQAVTPGPTRDRADHFVPQEIFYLIHVLHTCTESPCTGAYTDRDVRCRREKKHD